MIKAIKKDAELIDEMDALHPGNDRFYIWWLGQSGYLLQWNGKRVLLDPYLSDSLTKKYAITDKPHTRISERVCAPELLRHIDIVTSSHNHTDHLDAETLIPVLKNNPGIHFVIPEANRSFVADRVQCAIDFPTGLNDGQSIPIGDFTFHGIPAKHNEIERDEAGNCKYMGYVIQFGQWCIYHSGDTLLFDELPDLLRSFSVDLTLLPINGNDLARRVAGNLDSREAVYLAKMIGARCVIPCHYDMFAFNTADVQDFITIAEQEQQRYSVLQGGAYYTGIK
jgi:L-ascorbate metabolism protein UlaG (beta-lactamase superfamily)